MLSWRFGTMTLPSGGLHGSCFSWLASLWFGQPESDEIAWHSMLVILTWVGVISKRIGYVKEAGYDVRKCFSDGFANNIVPAVLVLLR